MRWEAGEKEVGFRLDNMRERGCPVTLAKYWDKLERRNLERSIKSFWQVNSTRHAVKNKLNKCALYTSASLKEYNRPSNVELHVQRFLFSYFLLNFLLQICRGEWIGNLEISAFNTAREHLTFGQSKTQTGAMGRK